MRLIASMIVMALVAWAASAAAADSAPACSAEPGAASCASVATGVSTDALPPAKRIQNVREVAGKWDGTIRYPNRVAPVSMTFADDGEVKWSAGDEKGTVYAWLVIGRLLVGSPWGSAFLFVLHEGDGKRILRSEDGTVEIRRAD